MTVETEIAKSGPYDGAGTVGPFTVGFRFLANDHLQAIRTDASSVDTVLVLDVDYTVSGAGNSTGSLTLTNPLPVGEKLTIVRNVPFTQEADYVNNDAFPAESHEKALDLGVMQAQQLRGDLERSIKIPPTLPVDFDTSLPATIASSPNQVLMVNATGDGIIPGPTATDVAGANASALAAQAAAAAAANSEENAATSETNAAASAAAAALAASSQLWRDVVFKTAADSPVTITSADRGKLFAIDASGGAVVLNLPQISSLSLATAFAVGVKKTDSSNNAVTITRSGTDTIDGATTKVIVSTGAGTTLIPDTDPAPDTWVTSDFGAIAGNLTDEIFASGVDFTAGTSTSVTLAGNYGSKVNLWVRFDGATQGSDTYTLVGTTLSFNAAIPIGVAKVYVKGGATLAIGTPADLTVSTQKLIDGSVTGQKLSDSVVNDLTTVSIASGDYVPLADISDSNKKKKAPVSDILALAVPAGFVLPFAGATLPTGWLECDGSAVSRATYSALFAAIGTTYGAGNGTTTFNLPELRGEFIRGWDHGRNIDTGRTLGSYQVGTVVTYDKSGTVGIQAARAASAAGDGANQFGADVLPALTDYPNVNEAGSIATSATLSTNSIVGVARPRNIAMTYGIKT